MKNKRDEKEAVTVESGRLTSFGCNADVVWRKVATKLFDDVDRWLRGRAAVQARRSCKMKTNPSEKKKAKAVRQRVCAKKKTDRMYSTNKLLTLISRMDRGSWPPAMRPADIVSLTSLERLFRMVALSATGLLLVVAWLMIESRETEPDDDC
jgi:hypothetical protein